MNSPKLSNGALQCIKISCACFARLGWEVLQQADFEDFEGWGTGPGVFGVWGKGFWGKGFGVGFLGVWVGILGSRGAA
jgi:hypothetical protein